MLRLAACRPARLSQRARCAGPRRRWLAEVGGVRFSNYSEWLLMASAWSLAPVPALALPVGRTAAGLPVGLQLVGPPGGDAAVVELAAALECCLSQGCPGGELEVPLRTPRVLH